jgi:ribose-phosphate pyrophosphokinase
MLELSNLLIEHGIEKIQLVCKHGLFSGTALSKLSDVPQITAIVTTDTIAQPPPGEYPKLQVESVAPVFADAIRRNYRGESIGDLFVYGAGSN